MLKFFIYFFIIIGIFIAGISVGGRGTIADIKNSASLVSIEKNINSVENLAKCFIFVGIVNLLIWTYGK
ncbi:MAG: hypothetical protein NTZ20_05425 [Candidatus Levybacteria bacterium]|nr:hypothetical protein [Candidatus Levybacteria bacterium]